MSVNNEFLRALSQLPRRYTEGVYNERRYGTTVAEVARGQKIWLFAKELGGKDHVGFNLYKLSDGSLKLNPCETSTEKVRDFVLGYEQFL